MTATTRGQRRTSDKHRYRAAYHAAVSFCCDIEDGVPEDEAVSAFLRSVAPHITEHAMQACRKARSQHE